MPASSLPPRVADIANGRVSWEKIEGLDFELLGYFLSCHLVIEHYIDECFEMLHPSLDWRAARHTFGQKVALLSKMQMSDRFDCIPAIKHLNALRNKISHQIAFQITTEELLPLSQYLSKAYQGKALVPSEAREILEQFTSMTCAFFAGMISATARIPTSAK